MLSESKSLRSRQFFREKKSDHIEKGQSMNPKNGGQFFQEALDVSEISD